MLRLVFAALLASISGLVSAAWQQATSKHFVVYADDDAQKVAAFAADLERFDKAMHLVNNVPDGPVGSASRVTVYVLPDQEAIEALKGSGVAGFYLPTAGRPTAFVPHSMSNNDDPRTRLSAVAVLRHEYAHHFMFNNFDAASLPLWLVEGFAEFNATAINNSDGSVTIGRAPLYRADAMFSDDGLGLKQILLAGEKRRAMTGPEFESIYAKGWLLVHYLTFEPSRRGQLGAYVKALHDGKGPTEAAQVFGDLRTLNRELGRYEIQNRLKAFTIAASALRIEPVSVQPISSGEAALIKIHIRSAAGVNHDQASSLVAPARRAARGYEHDAGAQLALAEVEYDAHNYAEAQDAADRSITADPRREKAYIYKGMALAALAKANKRLDKASWNAVRAPMLKANRLDPDDAAALKLFYESFADAGDVPNANARAGLQQALSLAPQDNELRKMVVADDIQAGSLADARNALLPLLSDPHSAQQRAWSAQLLAAIDSGDKEAVKGKLQTSGGSKEGREER